MASRRWLGRMSLLNECENILLLEQALPIYDLVDHT